MTIMPFPTTQQPDIIQMLVALLDEARKTNDLLREEIDLLKSMPRGYGNNKPQPDIIISEKEGEFILEFKLKYAKEDDQKAKNKERKAAIQALATAGLGANKHYRIVKVPKSNEKGKTWDEWYFHFPPQHAQAVGERLKQAIEQHKAVVDNLDTLDKLCGGVAQVDIPISAKSGQPGESTTPQDKDMQFLHIIGNLWAKYYHPQSKWDTVRYDFAHKYLGRKVESFKEYKPEQIQKLTMVILQQLIGYYGGAIYGTDWLKFKEAELVSYFSNQRTDVLNNLTVAELKLMQGKMATRHTEHMNTQAQRKL